MVVTVLPIYAKDHNLDVLPSQYSYMLCAFYIASLVSAAFYKSLCNLVSEEKTVLFASVIALTGIISAVGMELTTNPKVFTLIGIFYRFCQGINYGIYGNYQNSLNMQTLTDSEFKQSQTIMIICNGLSNMVGPLINLFTYKTFGLISCFTLCTIIEVVSCVFMAFYMGRALRHTTKSNDGTNCQVLLTDSEQSDDENISFSNFPAVKLLIAIEFICGFSCQYWLEGITGHLIDLGYG